MIQKTPGQLAYEEDVRRKPTYDGGLARAAWDKLADHVKESWERNPTPRAWDRPGMLRRTVPIVLVGLALAGCVQPYTLGTVQRFPDGTQIARGADAARYQLDKLECKRRAEASVSDISKRDLGRLVWADCMTVRGYAVTPASE